MKVRRFGYVLQDSKGDLKPKKNLRSTFHPLKLVTIRSFEWEKLSSNGQRR